MVTTVGLETARTRLVQNLVRLEYDAIAAYDAMLDRLKDDAVKRAVAGFRGDHNRHLDELGALASRLGIEVPTRGGAKSLLTKGKVVLANLGGDSAMLDAMKTNENDTMQAYRQAARNAEADDEMKRLFDSAGADEERHREWMETHSR